VRRRQVRLLGVSLLAVTLVAAGCSKNSGNANDSDKSTGKSTAAVLVDDASGPAPAVAGAKTGGTITLPESADFEHLDPQRAYVVTANVVDNIITRTLTAYRENGDGKLEVVGDLATNTGEKSNGGKTWTFHLRDGIKYEDGSTITSQDVAYGIARSFSPDLSEGPHWIQQWLAGNNYNATYKGPYNGASKLPPGVTTPDAKTIVFNFPNPEPDLPFALTLGTDAPVPAAKDTKIQYDNRIFSSGPYKIASYVRNQKLTLVKNTQWDPKTDPIRHQYPDKVVVDFTVTADQATNALIADHPADQASLTGEDMAVSAALYPKAIATASSKARILHGPTQFVWQLNINTQKVTDLKVRQALNYAVDKQGLLKVWGSFAGQPASTILSPTTSGYKKYDAYPAGANGDPAKAKELLGNKRVKLTYAYRNTERNQQIAAFLVSNLKQSGFDVTAQPVDKDQWYTVIGKKNNPYDFYMTGWGSDWPGASTVIPVLQNGATITPTGNSNYSYFNVPEVNDKIASILKETDLTKAAGEWADLDQEIMTKYAPEVPVIYDQQTTMYGSKVGGIYLSIPYGTAGLNNIYVK
jgi:peptide/nickel transport system substrate-binding protein